MFDYIPKPPLDTARMSGVARGGMRRCSRGLVAG